MCTSLKKNSLHLIIYIISVFNLIKKEGERERERERSDTNQAIPLFSDNDNFIGMNNLEVPMLRL